MQYHCIIVWCSVVQHRSAIYSGHLTLICGPGLGERGVPGGVVTEGGMWKMGLEGVCGMRHRERGGGCGGQWRSCVTVAVPTCAYWLCQWG